MMFGINIFNAFSAIAKTKDPEMLDVIFVMLKIQKLVITTNSVFLQDCLQIKFYCSRLLKHLAFRHDLRLCYSRFTLLFWLYV